MKKGVDSKKFEKVKSSYKVVAKAKAAPKKKKVIKKKPAAKKVGAKAKVRLPFIRFCNQCFPMTFIFDFFLTSNF